EPTAGADPVDGGDDRLPHVLMPGGEVEVPVLDALAVALHTHAVAGDLGDVDAGLEGPAGAGVDDDADLGVVVELAPGVGELVAHPGVHRVQLIRPVVDQPADGPVALD